MYRLLLLAFFVAAAACHQQNHAQTLYAFQDSSTNLYGFKDKAGKTVIAPQYTMAFSEELKHYAAVASEQYIIGIDAKGNELYRIFNYDNGPDYASEGLFRIQGKDRKFGYANAKTGAIVIAPQYARALPFEKGRAKVSQDDNADWTQGTWYQIDKKGRRR